MVPPEWGVILEAITAVSCALVAGRRAPGPSARTLDSNGARIRCPLCSWQPQKADRWVCEPGCGLHWNTFETAGVCPGCGRTWEETACLRCRRWSRHAAWYEAER